MFWELPKVENAWKERCHKWCFNDSETSITGAIDVSGDKQDISSPQTTIAIVGSAKAKKKSSEMGFVDKLIQLWKLKRSILEAKAEISVSDTLAKYMQKAGEAIMYKMLNYKSF